MARALSQTLLTALSKPLQLVDRAGLLPLPKLSGLTTKGP